MRSATSLVGLANHREDAGDIVDLDHDDVVDILCEFQDQDFLRRSPKLEKGSAARRAHAVASHHAKAGQAGAADAQIPPAELGKAGRTGGRARDRRKRDVEARGKRQPTTPTGQLEVQSAIADRGFDRNLPRLASDPCRAALRRGRTPVRPAKAGHRRRSAGATAPGGLRSLTSCEKRQQGYGPREPRISNATNRIDRNGRRSSSLAVQGSRRHGSASSSSSSGALIP